MSSMVVNNPQAVYTWNEAADMVQSGQLTYLTPSNSNIYMEQIFTVNDSFFQKFRTGFNRNPPVIEPNFTRIMEMLDESPTYIWFWNDMKIVMLRGLKCNVIYSDYYIGAHYHYMLRKGSKYTERLNLVITGNSRIAIARLIKKYFRRTACNIDLKKDYPPLHLHNLKEIALIGLSGLIASTVMFCLEGFLRLYKDYRNFVDFLGTLIF